MSIYPGDRPLSRYITDREFRKLEIFPELVEALEEMTNAFPLQKPESPYFLTYCKALAVVKKARKEMVAQPNIHF